MKLRLPWFNRPSGEELSELETQLEAVFSPVSPRASFVQNLERQLMAAPMHPDNALTTAESSVPKYVLIGAVSVFSGTFVLVTGIRAVIALLGAFGIWQQARQLKEQQMAG